MNQLSEKEIREMLENMQDVLDNTPPTEKQQESFKLIKSQVRYLQGLLKTIKKG